MNQPVKPPENDVAGPKARHKTTQVMVGHVAVGGGAPIVVQSMTNTDTADVEGTIAQVAALSRAGSELVRITVDRDEAAAADGNVADHDLGGFVPRLGAGDVVFGWFRSEEHTSELQSL